MEQGETCGKRLSQVSGLDFDETFAPIAKLESIYFLLAYATHHCFKLFQMDVKSIFLNGPLKEEVYMEQPPGFEVDKYPDYVFKLNKVLYGFQNARDSNLWRSLQGDIFNKEDCGLKSVIGSLERGWVQSSYFGTPQHG